MQIDGPFFEPPVGRADGHQTSVFDLNFDSSAHNREYSLTFRESNLLDLLALLRSNTEF